MGLDEIYARMKKRQTEQNERAEQNKKEKQKASGGLEAVYDRMRAAAQSENYNNTVKSQRATAERAAKTGNPVAISDTEAIRRQRAVAQYYRTGAAAGAAYENKPIMQADQSVKTPATDYLARTIRKRQERDERDYARAAMSYGKQITEAQKNDPALYYSMSYSEDDLKRMQAEASRHQRALELRLEDAQKDLEPYRKVQGTAYDMSQTGDSVYDEAAPGYAEARAKYDRAVAERDKYAQRSAQYSAALDRKNADRLAAMETKAQSDPYAVRVREAGRKRFEQDNAGKPWLPDFLGMNRLTRDTVRQHLNDEDYAKWSAQLKNDVLDTGKLEETDKDTFFYLYATDPEAAMEWIENRKNERQQEYYAGISESAGKDRASRENAFFGGVLASIGAGLLYGADVDKSYASELAHVGQALTGGGAKGLEEHGIMNTGALSRKGVMGTGKLAFDVPEEIPYIGGKGLGAFYELGTSMLQSAAVMPLGPEGAIILGYSAAASDYAEMKDQGFSDEEATLHAACAGLAESIFEYASLENLLGQNVTEGFVRNALKQAGIEASEEINTTIANTITDEAILGSRSKRARRVQELMVQGMSYSEAVKKSDAEWLSDMVYDGIAGFASGGLMTAGHLAGSMVYSALENRNIQRYQNIYSGAQLAQNENLRAGVDELAKGYGIKGLEQERVNAAQEIQTKYEQRAKEESERQSEAQAQKNGERIATTDESAGLAMTETEEAQKTKTELRQERKEARQERRERNRDLSVYEKNARKLGKTGEAVVSRITEDFKGAKTLAQIEAKKSALVENAQNKQGVGELADIAAERVISDEYEKAKTLSELEQLHKAYAANVKDEGLRRAAGRVYATQSFILQKNAAEGRLSRQKSRYAYAGQNLDMTASYERDGQTVVTKIQKISEDGRSVVMENGETMAVKDLHLDADTKDVLQKLTSYGIDGQSANYLLQQIQTAQETNRTSMYEIMSQYLLAFAQGQNGAITMEEAIRRSTLDAKTAEIAYKQGQKYAEEQAQKHKAEREENRKGRSERTLKEGQTRANRKGINGRRSIIDKSAIRGMNLNSQQSEQVRLATAVAEALGVDIRFWASTANEKGEFRGKQGEYHDGVIEIDVNAGRYTTADLKSGILRTMAHELTHFIQDFSEDMYEDLKRTAFEVLGKKGYDSFEALVDGKLSRASYDMTRMEAEDEVLADACELMLRDSKVLQQAYAQNETLGKKLLQWVARVIAKIKAYVGDAEHVEANWIDQMDAELRKAFQDKWDAALRNASMEFGESFAEANEGLAKYGVQIDSESGAAVQESIRTAPVTEKEIEDAVRRLVESDMGFDAKEARKWLKSLSTVSSVILTNMMVLDYENDSRYSWLKKNSDYTQGSVDFNNNCPKRVQFTAIFDRLQKEMPNRVFTASDYEAIRQTLIKHGVTVTCGPCFVEDRRQHTGEIAQKFIDQLKYGTLAQKFQTKVGNDSYIPTQYDLVTYDGLKQLYETHRGLHDAFVAFNNARGMAAARLLEGMAEYNNQIKKWSKRTIQSKNSKGGLRIFSLSDADPRTMIDTIQIVIDAAEKGLMIQGYTKKPWFARMVKDTGIRLLRSNIPKGVGFRDTANGRVLVYDLEEGINRYDRYYKDKNGVDIGYSSKNIGDNIIGINDDMIRVAMATEEIDQIIPFHSSLANYIRNQKKIGDWKNYKDEQTDKDARTGKVADKQINIYKDVLNAYKAKGNPIQNRQQFVDAFLEVCKDRGLTPRFERFLDKKNGEYVYTPGYEKFLVDYKLFDRKTGDIITQEAVKPIFDDEFNQQILTEYVSGAEGVKVADEDTYQAVKGLFAEETDGAKYSERETDRVSDADVIAALDEAAAPNREAAALVREAKAANTEISDLAKWRDKARHNADLLRQALASKNRDISELEKALDSVRKDLKEQTGEKRDWRDKARRNAELLRMAMNSKNKDIADITAQLTGLQQTLERGAAVLDERIARGQRILEAKQRNPVVREMIEKTRKAVEERKNAQIGRIRETRKASELRGRIVNLRDQIQRKILHPTETSYIPAELSKAMVAVLDALDVSPREGTKAAEKYADVSATLHELSAAYAAMNSSDSLLNQIDYDQDVRDKLDELAKITKGKTIREMNSAELQEVYSIVKQISDTARDAAYTIGRRERQSLYNLGMTEIENQHNLGTRKHLLRGARLDALSPMRAVHMMGGFGDSVIYDFWRDIEDGQGEKDRVVMDSNKTMQALRAGKNEAQYLRSVWQQKDYGIKDIHGKTVLLTPMQAMQIVMSWEREAANDKLRHIENGGILVRDARDVMTGKAKAKAGQKVQLTQDDVIRIEGKLTEYDKQYMAAARKVFRSLFGQTNDVLYQIKHRVNVGEDLYIPFVVNDELLPVAMDRGNEVDVLTKINGATKELKPGAAQGIVIDGLENVLNRHINQQADFIGLAIPIRNLAKLLNVKTVGKDASVTTVKEAISEAWGEKAYSMMTQTLRNLQSMRDGGYETGVSKAMQKLQEAFVKAALVGKISVAIKQAASYESAGSYLSQRALAAARHNILEFFLSPNNPHAKKVMERWDARTAELFKRRIGMSMEEIAMNRMSNGAIKRSLQRVGAQLEKNAVGRAVRDVGQATDPVNWIQRMDVATTMALAVACEYQARIDGYKKGTAEYEQHVTELYERVLRDTQPQYDALHRPMLQQSTKRGMELVKAVMPFRTVPFQNFGQLADTFGEVQNAFRTKTGQKEAVKKFGKTVLSQFNSSVVFAMLTALAYGLKHNVKRYLDDDDELTQESFWRRFWKDVGDTNLSTLLPYGGSEIEEIVEKWSKGEKSTYDLFSVGSLDLLNTTYKSVEKMRDVIEQYAAGEKTKAEMLDQIKATAYQVSQMLGIPAKNIREIVTGIEGNINGGFFTDADVDRTDAKNVERYLKAYDAGDDKKMTAVYNEIVRNFVAKGKTEEDAVAKIADGVHGRIKDDMRNGKDLSSDVELLWQLGQTQEKTEQYISGAAYSLYKKGEIDAETAIDAATRYGGKTKEDAEHRTQAIAFNLENEELGWDVTQAESYLFKVPAEGEQTQSAAQYGITPEEYQRYKDAVSGAAGEDKNGDGKTDSGTKKKAVIAALRNAGFTGGKLLWFVNAAGYKDTTVK